MTRLNQRAVEAALPEGFAFQYLPEVDSTNRVARDAWRAGRRGPLLIATDFQSAGRGRRGRTWSAPPGTSVLSSFLLPPVAEGGTRAVMAACLAAVDAIERSLGTRCQLKWPNDVLLAERKVCGILAEMLPDGSVVLGIGINVNRPECPGSLPEDAAALSDIAGMSVNRQELLIALASFVDVWYRMLNRDPDALWRAWVARLQTIGQPVIVHEHNQTWEGTAERVDRDGALIVRTHSGHLRTLYAADVSVRSQ